MSKKDKGATGAETNTSDIWVPVGSKTIVFPHPESSPTADKVAGAERSGLSNSYRSIGDLDHAVQLMGNHSKLLSDPRFRIRPLQQVLSACAGAMITACFMTPLDVIKTRMQLQHSSSNKCFFYSNGLMDHLFPCGSDGAPNILRRRQKPQFTSTRDALIKISRHEGIWTLWSGLGPTLVSALPSTIIYFVAYEQFKAKYVKLYQNHLKKKSQR